MNKILYDQLKLVTETTIDFNENTTKLFIPRTIKLSSGSMKVGQAYRIRLESFITNPSPESTLASNWNNGIVPKYNEYIIEVSEKIGTMVKVIGVASEDHSSQFVGWLPIGGIEVLEKV